MRLNGFLTTVVTMLAFVGCAGGVLKPTNEILDVKLRRFEVLNASFDQMSTEVIVEVKSAAAKPFQATQGQLEVTVVGHAVVDETGTHVESADSDTSFTGKTFPGILEGQPEVIPGEKTLLRSCHATFTP